MAKKKIRRAINRVSNGAVNQTRAIKDAVARQMQGVKSSVSSTVRNALSRSNSPRVQVIKRRAKSGARAIGNRVANSATMTNNLLPAGAGALAALAIGAGLSKVTYFANANTDKTKAAVKGLAIAAVGVIGDMAARKLLKMNNPRITTGATTLVGIGLYQMVRAYLPANLGGGLGDIEDFYSNENQINNDFSFYPSAISQDELMGIEQYDDGQINNQFDDQDMAGLFEVSTRGGR